MKQAVTLLIMALMFSASDAQDLPGPSANLQTLPTGSYVFAMDNTLQLNSAGDFNLKTYGLVVYLLNNNVKIKWCIKAGKAKDAIDLTGTAEKLLPTFAVAAIRNFKAGPFVVYASDTSGVSSLITNFYTTNSLTGNNRPNVYRLTAPVVADIRYDLTGFVPKAGILTDGGNQNIHKGYMTNCAIPITNYTTAVGSELLTRCFTFASEPHSDNPENVTIIKSFVQAGGNFLAQCAAIETYENYAAGHMQTNNGISVVNSGVSMASVIYPNADLSYSQFEGVFDIKYGGSVNNWVPATGSTYINNTHNHATGGTMATQTPVGASVSKLNSAGDKGGLVFYLGNHNFSSITSIESINGIRMYINAFLTPVSINNSCTAGISSVPLAVKLLNFQGNMHDQKVALNWSVATNEMADHFEIEKSIDGTSFRSTEDLFATDVPGTVHYNVIQMETGETSLYFRLKMHDKTGVVTYSKVLIFRSVKNEGSSDLRINMNPVDDKLNFSYNSSTDNTGLIRIYNINGTLVMKQQAVFRQGINTLVIPLNQPAQPGLYFIELNIEGTKSVAKFIKR